MIYEIQRIITLYIRTFKVLIINKITNYIKTSPETGGTYIWS